MAILCTRNVMISPGEASKVVLTSHVFMSQLMLTYLIVLFLLT